MHVRLQGSRHRVGGERIAEARADDEAGVRRAARPELPAVPGHVRRRAHLGPVRSRVQQQHELRVLRHRRRYEKSRRARGAGQGRSGAGESRRDRRSVVRAEQAEKDRRLFAHDELAGSDGARIYEVRVQRHEPVRGSGRLRIDHAGRRQPEIERACRFRPVRRLDRKEPRSVIKPFSETTVLVTGGSRGIGAAIAQRFASVGMQVVIHYLSSHESANETARACLAYGANVLTVTADIRSKEQLLRMREKMEKHGMMPDIVVNNAGVAHYGMLQDVTEEEWTNVMDVNLKGMFLCTQTFMDHMVRQKYGRIINVSSVWGISGASCEVVYSTAKGGVNAFTKALAKELAPSGVTVNAVAPGVVETSMNANLNVAEKEALQNDIPAGRFAHPDEIASLVYFIALPESGYITGQIISPNGGWLT
ncbi:hypothetical protein DLM86_29780 [Paenibacillus flagellatus]|uniref:Ketoreductase domain-containing protein n=1 Tax=Paenibacillus flagellatus TaxID=2211139 RepID=A0A2V5KJ91_9BACL|nr:hypothetical protein DLM86_29780 [Paenibacillus flagellatus]